MYDEKPPAEVTAVAGSPATEIRRDAIVDRWVIFSPARAARPNEYSTTPPAHATGPCPFCEGNERLATPEIAAIRTPGTAPHEPGWQVRVVPNKFPAVAGVTTLNDGHLTPEPTTTTAFGLHEVIVESPRHLASITKLTAIQLADVLGMYRSRMAFAGEEPQIRHALVFKNVGPGAGASMEHLHSQLIGLPLVPTDVADELRASQAFHAERGNCVFCHLLEHERNAKLRLVEETAHFTAFCPYAPRFPFETWLFPRSHESRFDRIPTVDLPELAGILRNCIDRIERTTGRAEYNYLIHSAPFDTCCQSHYHWHIEIFPRLAQAAGFEWGTGMFINSVFPEEAARKLRAALS